MFKLWVAIHSIECAWCCLHCLPSQGFYGCVVLAWTRISWPTCMSWCTVALCLLLNHVHAAQVSHPFPMHACNQQKLILTGCIWLQQPPVRKPSNVNLSWGRNKGQTCSSIAIGDDVMDKMPQVDQCTDFVCVWHCHAFYFSQLSLFHLGISVAPKLMQCCIYRRNQNFLCASVIFPKCASYTAWEQ